MLTAILDIAHLIRIAAREHLVHKPIVVAGIVARMDVFEPLPVLDKDLFEDVPVLRRLCNHQIALREGVGLLGIKRFYHVSLSESTPSSVCTATPSPTSLALEIRGRQGSRKMNFPIRLKNNGPVKG